MIGVITIEHLEISCVIGVDAHERRSLQSIFVDLVVEYEMSQCIRTDHLHDTIDYVALAAICTSVAQEGNYRLLESYTHDAIEAIMAAYPVRRVKMKVRKPSAIAQAKFAAVEMERSNP